MKTRSKATMGRFAPLDISPREFKKIGLDAVDQVARHLSGIRDRKVTVGLSPKQARKLLGSGRLPRKGMSARKLMSQTARMLFANSLFNGHPRFWGYISGAPAPIGILGDFLGSTVNPNVGAFVLSPVATEIESQTIRWLAEMIGFPPDCGGILVSGGNMANFVCFVAARKAKLDWNVREKGFNASAGRRFRIYTSAETHTWIQKATDLFGFGTDSIRWIPVDGQLRMNVSELRKQIHVDKSKGEAPLMVIGTAGSVGTGAIDPLAEIADICKENGLWFHVDGAYGALAAVVSDAPADLKALDRADSVAVDPHKWLYIPLEAGCALVRKPEHLLDAFSYHPPYYKFEGKEGDEPTNFYERGLQNSRGFRALKVWLALKQVGRDGYEKMISEDIRLAGQLFRRIQANPDLEACTLGLSITTFRYVPQNLKQRGGEAEQYLNKLNTELLSTLQASGDAFCSNTLIADKFVLRTCIVNFRTSIKDIEAFPELILKIGRKLDKGMRPQELRRY